MRFGRFNRVAGPGIVFTIPIVEFYTVRIDQRVASVYFGAEETLTKDLVPVNVDAVLFWMVFDPEKAAVEVEDYVTAVSWVAQTSMREAIGRISVAELATRREQLDDELKDRIEQKLPLGASTSSTWRCATSSFRRSCKRPWPPRPLPSANAMHASCWPRPSRIYPPCSPTPPKLRRQRRCDAPAYHASCVRGHGGIGRHARASEQFCRRIRGRRREEIG